MHGRWDDESEETRLLTPVRPAVAESDETWLLTPVRAAVPPPAVAPERLVPAARRGGPPPRPRIAFGSLTGLLSGFAITLAMSLVALGAADGEPGLRLSIPGRHHPDADPGSSAPGIVVPTFALPVDDDLPAATVTSPGASVTPTSVTHTTTAGAPTSPGRPPGAVPIPSSQGTSSVVAIPPPSASPAPSAAAPTATATAEPDPEPTAAPEPSESVTAPAVAP